jgi:hypothetical protein
MQVDRRSFLSSLAAALGCPALALAEQGQGLFWRVETRGWSAVLFGYMRLPASKGLYIVDDGIRIIEQTQSVIRDFSYNLQCPTINFRTDMLPPLLQRLSPAVADEVRSAVAAFRIPQPQLERENGYAVVMFLLGEGTEGEANPIPSVGGLISDRATALHRPLTTLLADDEVQKLYCPTLDDVVAVNNHVDEKLITSILNLRKRVGPIGSYIDGLYVGRKTDELALYFKYMEDHDISWRPHFTRGSLIELLFPQLSARLPSMPNPFVFLPVETLIGAGGILERFREQGADVGVLA